MATALLAAAAAPSYPVLLAALALYGPGSGLGTGLAESALAAADPARREAALARWNLAGTIGDLLAPAALAAAVALGLGWRGALAAVAALTVLHAIALARTPQPAAGAGPDEEEVPGAGTALGAAIRAAVGAPALLGWTVATALCSFLDEVLVSFGALWLDAQLGASPAERAAVFVAWEVGAIAGSVALERLVHRAAPRTLLLGAGLGSLASYVAWLAAPGWQASAAAAAVSGLFTAAHYPLLKARAFAALPGRPELVQAVGSAVGALDLAIPVAVGLVADRAGLLAAMALLAAQPVGVVVAALASRTARAPAPERTARRTSKRELAQR